MWRITGKITNNIRACCCRTPSNVSQGTGARCSLCTKPGSAAPPPPQGATPTARPPPPPPPPSAPRKSRGGVKAIIGGLLIGTGATVGALAYAKANPEFRRQVESNWPILLDVFPYFFDDEAAAAKTATKTKLDNQLALGGARKIKSLGSTELTSGTGKASSEPTSVRQKAHKTPSTEPGTSGAATKLAAAAPKASQELAAELKREEDQRQSQALEEKLLEEEIDEAANIAAYEAIVETCLGDSVETTRVAMDTSKQAVDATKTHTEKLKLAMEDLQEADSEMKKRQWDEVVIAAEAKLQAVSQASKEESAAREALLKLKTIVEEAKQTKTKAGLGPRIIGAQSCLNQMTYDLESSNSQLIQAQNEARILKNYHELIDRSREEFKKEMESLMPEAKLGRRGKKLSEEELNALLAHAHRRVYQLQQELAEQQALEQKRLSAALGRQQEEDDQVTKSRVIVELERQSADLAVIFQRKEEDLLQMAEQELRLQLRRQAAAHSDHLSDVLKQQEKDFSKELLVQESVVREHERDNYYRQLTGAMAKLRGVEAAVEGRAGLELQNRRAQELWLACETLKQTICNGKTEGNTWEEKLMPLASEIAAIQEAAPSNQFVESVIQTIPEKALSRGVYNEDSLRQRWEQTQRVCRRVAMIDEAGGTIFSYFLSYFQSLLVLSEPIAPTSEEGVDPSALDTFKLVAFASHHLENGNLEQALRYANQLTGMPRKVAADWLAEARLLLETSQAASVLSSHASASGLGGLNFN